MITNTLPASLQTNPRLDRWLAFPEAGRVRLSVGKVEIGQGIITALAQIAAEELSVDPQRLDITAGDTDAAPDEGMTVGSMSVEVSGASVRLVCAEARSLFLQQAAAAVGCAATELSIADGAVMRGLVRTGQDYWTLAPSVSLARDVTGTAPVRPRSAYTVVGTSAARRDLPAKIFGAGFLHDLALPGMRHARMIRHPRRGAVLVGLDEAAIGRLGDVRVVRRGNFAAVIAPTESDAKAARDAANPRWSGVETITPDQGEAVWLVGRPAADTAYGAPASGAVGSRHSATFSRPFIAHASIGPSCALAAFVDGHLTVWAHTQGVYPLRTVLAEITGLAQAAISVRHGQGPGCYGHNGADDVAFDAAIIAMECPGHPIRLQWEREEEFGYEPLGTAMRIHIDATLDAAGRPVDWTTEIWSAAHTNRGRAASTPTRQALPDPPELPPAVENPPENGGGATRNAFIPYDVPAQRVALHLVQRPPMRTSALRGLGALPNVFAIEGFMDELAERAGIDPITYRLSLLSDPRARRVIETVAGMAGWNGRGAGGGRGRGIGYSRYKNRAAYAAVIVEVEVDERVRLRRVWCAADGGLIINPDGAINQLEGGIVQAASMTLMEQVRFGGAGVASTNWDTYPILRFSEVPEISSSLVEASEHPSLGMGECTMGPTAAAIGNAVAQALGTRLRDMPLSRDRIMATLLA